VLEKAQSDEFKQLGKDFQKRIALFEYYVKQSAMNSANPVEIDKETEIILQRGAAVQQESLKSLDSILARIHTTREVGAKTAEQLNVFNNRLKC